MVQTLARGEIEDFVRRYGHVVIDECHHVPAVSIERVLAAIPARYITGLTAHRIGEAAISPSSACNAVRSVISSMRPALSSCSARLAFRLTA
jgi:hypothetical protein